MLIDKIIKQRWLGSFRWVLWRWYWKSFKFVNSAKFYYVIAERARQCIKAGQKDKP